jgi:hypothetical protein
LGQQVPELPVLPRLGLVVVLVVVDADDPATGHYRRLASVFPRIEIVIALPDRPVRLLPVDQIVVVVYNNLRIFRRNVKVYYISTNQLCLDRPTLGFTHVHNLDLPDNEMLSQGHEFFTELTQFQTFSYANSVNVSFQWCQLVPRFGDICSLANTKQNVFGREFKFCAPSTHVSRCRFVLTPTPHGTSALSHPSLTR